MADLPLITKTFFWSWWMADIKKEDWEMIKASSGWNEVDLRDNNYNQIVHMVSAADGAEDFYTIQGHGTRLESPEQAREMDVVTANVSSLIMTAGLFGCFFRGKGLRGWKNLRW